MNEKKRKTGRLIGYILLTVLFAAISVFFIAVLVSSNNTFFIRNAQSKFFAPDIMIGIIIAAIVIMAVLSVTMRKSLSANKALLYCTGILSLLGAITFMILLSAIGPFDIAWENANLYIMYFLFVALANAYIIFAAIRNIRKNKAVVFAKSLSDATPKEADSSES